MLEENSSQLSDGIRLFNGAGDDEDFLIYYLHGKK